jgi:hypothetical protein
VPLGGAAKAEVAARVVDDIAAGKLETKAMRLMLEVARAGGQRDLAKAWEAREAKAKAKPAPAKAKAAHRTRK